MERRGAGNRHRNCRGIGPIWISGTLKLFTRIGCGRRVCGPLHFLHRSNETEALALQGFDETLFFAGIANHTPSDVQPRRQCRIGHDTAVPDGLDEVVLADDPFPVADQVIEQVEHLRRDGDHVRPAVKLAKVGVECVLLEEIPQAGNSLGEFPPSVSRAGCTARISRR